MAKATPTGIPRGTADERPPAGDMPDGTRWDLVLDDGTIVHQEVSGDQWTTTSEKFGSLSADHIENDEGTVEIGDDVTQADVVNDKPNIAIGQAAKATHDDCVTLGRNVQSTDVDQVLIGHGANATTGSERAIAIGDDVECGRRSIAIGTLTNAGETSIVMGDDISPGTNGHSRCVALVPTTNDSDSPPEAVTGNNSVVIGQNGLAGSNSVAIGKDAEADGTESVVVGRAAGSSANYSVAIGDNATVSGKLSVAIGDNTSVSTERLARIGTNQLVFGGVQDTVSDADLGNSELTVELDETNSAFRLRGKDSSGTVREATVAW